MVDRKGHKKSAKPSKSLADAELMPPPNATAVPRSKVPLKSVAFLNATPTKIPPPRPPPPKLVDNMVVDDEMRGRQGKTPAGVRSVPTKYFGPKEKYQRLTEKDFSGGRLIIGLFLIPTTMFPRIFLLLKLSKEVKILTTQAKHKYFPIDLLGPVGPFRSHS